MRRWAALVFIALLVPGCFGQPGTGEVARETDTAAAPVFNHSTRAQFQDCTGTDWEVSLPQLAFPFPTPTGWNETLVPTVSFGVMALDCRRIVVDGSVFANESMAIEYHTNFSTTGHEGFSGFYNGARVPLGIFAQNAWLGELLANSLGVPHHVSEVAIRADAVGAAMEVSTTTGKMSLSATRLDDQDLTRDEWVVRYVVEPSMPAWYSVHEFKHGRGNHLSGPLELDGTGFAANEFGLSTIFSHQVLQMNGANFIWVLNGDGTL